MLVPNDFSIGLLLDRLRGELKLKEEHAIYVYAKNKSGKLVMLKASKSFLISDDSINYCQVNYRNADGFLYVYYQELATYG